jgi:hypothetical protein
MRDWLVGGGACGAFRASTAPYGIGWGVAIAGLFVWVVDGERGGWRSPIPVPPGIPQPTVKP